MYYALLSTCLTTTNCGCIGVLRSINHHYPSLRVLVPDFLSICPRYAWTSRNGSYICETLPGHNVKKCNTLCHTLWVPYEEALRWPADYYASRKVSAILDVTETDVNREGAESSSFADTHLLTWKQAEGVARHLLDFCLTLRVSRPS